MTVTGLASRARISRKTFYDYFADRDRCVDYAAEEAAGYLRNSTAQVEPERPTDELIAARVDALLNAVAVEPKIAELALIHGPALGGQRGRRSQEVAMSTITALLGEVGEGRPARGSETIASAIIGVIACRLRRGEAERIGDLAEEIVRLARLPAVGVDRAAPGRPG